MAVIARICLLLLAVAAAVLPTSTAVSAMRLLLGASYLAAANVSAIMHQLTAPGRAVCSSTRAATSPAIAQVRLTSLLMPFDCTGISLNPIGRRCVGLPLPSTVLVS